MYYRFSDGSKLIFDADIGELWSEDAQGVVIDSKWTGVNNPRD